jgi:glycine dehydrogenase
VKLDPLGPSDTFLHRHLGPREADLREMLEVVGAASLDALVAETIPEAIRRREPVALDGLDDATPRGEAELLAALRAIAQQNRPLRSCTSARATTTRSRRR